MTKEKPLEEEYAGDNATIEWLKMQKDTTRHTYKSFIAYFFRFTGMNGDQLIADRKQDTEHKWERKIMEFRNWCIEQGLSPNAAKTAVSTARSLFASHYVRIELRREDGRKISKVARETEDYKLTKETMAKMYMHANLKEKYVLIVGKSLGLRASGFIALTKGIFSSVDLDQEAPINLGQINTIKENIQANPFLDSDAVPIVKEYLETVMKDKSATDRMLPIRKEELTVILQSLAKKANIDLGGKFWHFHCLRKFLITRLASVTSESKYKQIVGKAITEGAYVDDEELREAYKKVMPLTSINGSTQNHLAIETLQKQIETLEQWCGELARQLIKDNPTVGLENATIQYLATKGKK